MTPHLMKLLGLSAALLAISQGVRAEDVKAPTFNAEPCCQLCPCLLYTSDAADE